VLGWEVGVAFSSFLAGTQIQGLYSVVLRKQNLMTESDTGSYRLIGSESSRDVHFQELAWNPTYDGDIELVGLNQHLLRAETPSCGMCHFNKACKRSTQIDHTLGRCRACLTRCGLLLHSHSPMGAFGESFDSGSVDDILRSRMGKPRTVLLDWNRC
jgi:hypothetical protein